MNIDLKKIKKIYVIGIKGSGIVAVVEILHSMGLEITGSDTTEKFFTDAILKHFGINYFEGFNLKNIPADVDLIIYSTAYSKSNNPEMAEAKKRNLFMVNYPEMLAYLFNQKFGLAVCGTHGKTTTSAMLAEAMQKSGVDPMAVIGSQVINWKSNALTGKGKYFIAETDEYQNKLSFYNPKAIILTSLDWDHPDFFKNFTDYKKVFKDFVARLPKNNFLIVWGDSRDTIEVSKATNGDALTYGFEKKCDYKISNLIINTKNISHKNRKIIQSFDIFFKNKSLGKFEIQLLGKHNVLNATAVIATCHRLRLDLKKVKKALGSFKGTKRRFEYIGQRNGAILIDDYAHHPQELMATLKGARELYPEKNIWVVFQAHTFSRTKALLNEFSQSFSDADKVIVLDIYSSARETKGGVHAKNLVELINKTNQKKAKYISTTIKAEQYLKNKIGPKNVVITAGAGNVWEVAKKLKE